MISVAAAGADPVPSVDAAVVSDVAAGSVDFDELSLPQAVMPSTSTALSNRFLLFTKNPPHVSPGTLLGV